MSDWLSQAWPQADETFNDRLIYDSSTERGERRMDSLHRRRWEKQPDAGMVREVAAGLELDRGDSSRQAGTLT